MPTRIIIADDEAIQRMDLRDVLTKQGYLVIGEAGDGQSAINLARELRPADFFRLVERAVLFLRVVFFTPDFLRAVFFFDAFLLAAILLRFAAM